jgi:hypothetical protein
MVRNGLPTLPCDEADGERGERGTTKYMALASSQAANGAEFELDEYRMKSMPLLRTNATVKAAPTPLHATVTFFFATIFSPCYR